MPLQIERLLASFGFRQFMRHATDELQTGRTGYLNERNALYERTATHARAGGHRALACLDEEFRYRDIDRLEALWRRDRERTAHGARGAEQRRTKEQQYQCELLTQGKYCDRIMKLSQEFGILHGDRDFCLNTHIAQRPERIEEFVQMLHEYCLLHNLIEK